MPCPCKLAKAKAIDIERELQQHQRDKTYEGDQSLKLRNTISERYSDEIETYANLSRRENPGLGAYLAHHSMHKGANIDELHLMTNDNVIIDKQSNNHNCSNVLINSIAVAIIVAIIIMYFSRC